MMADDMIREDPDTLEDRQYVCEQCGKDFDTIQALNGHKMIHIPGGACPECGRDDFATATSLARHRSIAHNVLGASKAAQGKAKAKLGRPPKVKVDDGLNVDHIFQSVIQTLYPQGRMPTTAMVPLMEWREATRTMLEALQSV